MNEDNLSHRSQRFFHQFDWYANPVTLTYNQKKSFPTIIGSVCTIFSAVLLIYYVLFNITIYLVERSYTQEVTQSAVDHRYPMVYNIDPL